MLSSFFWIQKVTFCAVEPNQTKPYQTIQFKSHQKDRNVSSDICHIFSELLSVSKNLSLFRNKKKKEKYWIYKSLNLPRLASYVCIYSEVMNCDTKAVLPVSASPNKTTLYL